MFNPFEQLIVTGAAWALKGCAAWAVVLVVAAVVETLSAGRVRATGWVPCPAAIRRGLVVLVGSAAVATSVGGPANATTWWTPSGRGAANGLPVPGRPSGGTPDHARAWAPPRTPDRSVVVRAGDSLWELVAERIPRADDRALAHAVEASYRRNRSVIGDDPDHIEPGQRLVLPVRRLPPAPASPTPDTRSEEH